MAVINSQAVSGRSMTKKGYQTDRAIKKLRGAFQEVDSESRQGLSLSARVFPSSVCTHPCKRKRNQI